MNEKKIYRELLILPDMRAAVDRFENLIMDFG